jgi:hemolysin activation/secretion protein
VPQGTPGATRTQPTDQFEASRLKADGNFITVHGSLAHTQKLRNDWELFSKISGQASDQPLVNSEQFGGGGMGTARGYLEAEALGDNGLFSTLELRTPSLLRMKRTVGTTEESTGNEWRFYAFGDMGTLTLHDVANEQQSSFRLASIGLGSELQLSGHFHGILELALPFTTLSTTHSHDASVNFRLWTDF